MPNNVTAVAAAPATDAETHFARRLAFETDCWDVHDAMSNGASDFVVLDVRGPDAYAGGHVPGAVSLPHAEIDAEPWSIARDPIAMARTRPPCVWRASVGRSRK